jgi:hypothetical protein
MKSKTQRSSVWHHQSATRGRTGWPQPAGPKEPKSSHYRRLLPPCCLQRPHRHTRPPPLPEKIYNFEFVTPEPLFDLLHVLLWYWLEKKRLIEVIESPCFFKINVKCPTLSTRNIITQSIKISSQKYACSFYQIRFSMQCKWVYHHYYLLWLLSKYFSSFATH